MGVREIATDENWLALCLCLCFEMSEIGSVDWANAFTINVKCFIFILCCCCFFAVALFHSLLIWSVCDEQTKRGSRVLIFVFGYKEVLVRI